MDGRTDGRTHRRRQNYIPPTSSGDKNVHMCYIRVIEGKIVKIENRRQNEVSSLIFIYTIHFAYLKGYTKFHNPISSSC